MRLELLERNTGTKVKKLQALTLSICLENCRIVATCLLCYSKTMELNSWLEMNSGTELVTLLYMHEHLFLTLVSRF